MHQKCTIIYISRFFGGAHLSRCKIIQKDVAEVIRIPRKLRRWGRLRTGILLQGYVFLHQDNPWNQHEPTYIYPKGIPKLRIKHDIPKIHAQTKSCAIRGFCDGFTCSDVGPGQRDWNHETISKICFLISLADPNPMTFFADLKVYHLHGPLRNKWLKWA